MTGTLSDSGTQVTGIPGAAQPLEAIPAAELLPLVYGDLRRLAAQKMARETPHQTLQPTALVHEAWMRFAGNGNPQFANRAHFFAAAAEAMRRILIDRARSKRAARHGGGQRRTEYEEGALIAESAADDQMLALNDALDKLAAQSPREAELVKLRYFVGMTLEEAANALGISERTADNYWAHARAWLFRELRHQ